MKHRIMPALVLLAAGCASTGPEPVASGVGTEALDVVRQHAAAFSARDMGALLDGVAPDIEWYSIDGGDVTLELTGRAALRDAMFTYFAETPTFRSEIEGAVVSGAFVSVRERATWQTPSGPRTQTAIGVFEVRDGVIRRAWYYPAQR